MHQAGAWPMAPQLGRAWYSAAPATQDGLSIENRDADQPDQTLRLATAMLEGLSRFATGGVEAMQLSATVSKILDS